jgi:hypothetical protein
LVEELLTFQPNPILRDQLLTVLHRFQSRSVVSVVLLHDELAVFQNKIGKRNARERNGVAFQRREIGIDTMPMKRRKMASRMMTFKLLSR